MSTATTGIAWTDRTWNPTRGCSRVSAGCMRCYAEVVAARFSGPGRPYEGLARWKDRAIDDDDSDGVALGGAWEREARWTGKIRLVPKALEEPLRWRKPARIFVNSMSDLFHEDVPDGFVDRVFAVMALAPRHTFQVLTKRAERMREYIAKLGTRSEAADVLFRAALADWSEEAACAVANGINGVLGEGHNVGWPMRNVHLGVSVENQETADERIPLLLQTPAAIRFLSVEPLLGPVDLENAVDWVIVGGESGPGARPCDLAWIRWIVVQCRTAGVPCFVKQLGAHPATRVGAPEGLPAKLLLRDRKGGAMEEWPEDLRVREFPG